MSEAAKAYVMMSPIPPPGGIPLLVKKRRAVKGREEEEGEAEDEPEKKLSRPARFSIDDLLHLRRVHPDSWQSSSISNPPSSTLLDPSAPLSSPSASTPSPTPATAEIAPENLLSDVDCRLEGSELWAKFFDLGTEMIITKSGRRMFPTVKVSVTTSPLDLDSLFYVFLDVVPVDAKRYRYIYNKSSWQTAGKAEPAPANRLYMHPDSPFTGEQLQKQMVSFEKAKLTNNDVEITSHLILNSMHKYQPRVHVVKRSRNRPIQGKSLNSLEGETSRSFTFPETQFMAVTAYQNQLITKLKIEKNPFAKGFRDPSGRDSDYESETRGEMRPLLPGVYNSALLQQALFSQYWLGKYPSLLSQVLLSSPLLNLPREGIAANAEAAATQAEQSPSGNFSPLPPVKSPIADSPSSSSS